MFVINLGLFIVFATLFLFRWLLFWAETKMRIFEDAEEIALLGAPAIAWFTITGQVALTCSEAWGYRLTVLAYVMWWMGAAWIFVVCSTLYICISKSALTDDEHLPTAVFLPIVGIMTTATIGGLICNYGKDINPRMAVPIIICSYLLLGYGLFLALAMYAAYLHRLIICGWPPVSKIPGMILTIGPMGQSATALQNLATAANQHQIFASYDRGFWLEAQPAVIIQATSVLLALLLLGFAVFWIFMAYFAIIQALIQRKLHFGLTWWSTIFPMGTVATATADLGTAMNSPVFKVVASIILVFLSLIFVVNTLLTVPMVLKGRSERGKNLHPFIHRGPDNRGEHRFRT
jgi:tellurite resistance protein TehA-like permease